MQSEDNDTHSEGKEKRKGTLTLGIVFQPSLWGLHLFILLCKNELGIHMLGRGLTPWQLPPHLSLCPDLEEPESDRRRTSLQGGNIRPPLQALLLGERRGDAV